MDEKTISEFGIDGFTLMEIAGSRAADILLQLNPAPAKGLFICGKGNNAGDALVVARLLSQQNYRVEVCFVSGTDDLSADCSKNLDLLHKLEGDIHIGEWNPEKLPDSGYDFIVDGMLGTGLDSDLRSPYDSAVEWINQQGSPVFALDIPTGLHSDNGRIMGTAVQADYTFSFGALKKGFYLNRGFDLCGEIILCELSFPNKYKKADAYLIDRQWVGEETISSKESRPRHKYDDGVLYIIAGSEGLTGAAILAARSAWATGIGAVTLITPRGLLEIYEKNLIQIIKKPVGNASDLFFTPEHLEEVRSIIGEKPGKLILGPGLGRNEKTLNFARELLSSCDKDILIDADGLFALAQSDSWEKPDESNWILSPHPGELSRLLGTDIEDGFDRLMQVTKLAKEKNITLLSKGLPSIVADNDGKAYLTGYDTKIFSRAGFGDVLAGKAAAYWLKEKTGELACMKALLDGKEKADRYTMHHNSNVEPINII